MPQPRLHYSVREALTVVSHFGKPWVQLTGSSWLLSTGAEEIIFSCVPQRYSRCCGWYYDDEDFWIDSCYSNDLTRLLNNLLCSDRSYFL
jgi:hypothetical protein